MTSNYNFSSAIFKVGSSIIKIYKNVKIACTLQNVALYNTYSSLLDYLDSA